MTSQFSNPSIFSVIQHKLTSLQSIIAEPIKQEMTWQDRGGMSMMKPELASICRCPMPKLIPSMLAKGKLWPATGVQRVWPWCFQLVSVIFVRICGGFEVLPCFWG